MAAECAAADRDAGAAPGTCRALVSELLPGVPDDTHPRDLSEGQRLALALAVVLTARPPLLLLDEPTRGLDYAAKARLVGMLRGLAAEGHAIVLATHDVELAAELAHRVVLLADGEVIADGPTADVVVASPSFAPAGGQDPGAAQVADGGRRCGRPWHRPGTAVPLVPTRQARAVRLGPRSVAALLLVSAVGVAAFGWPLPGAARLAGSARTPRTRPGCSRGCWSLLVARGGGDDLGVGAGPEGRGDARRAGGDGRGPAPASARGRRASSRCSS